MIFLFSDFQHRGPYCGELAAAIARECDHLPIHLMHDAPAFQPGPAGRLLEALSRQFKRGDHCLAIVDPGVGGPRRPAAVKANGCWFVGPDNGLLSVAAESDPEAEWWEITWHPETLSSSFHGRDLFAPFIGRLIAGHSPTAIGARPLYDPEPNRHPAESIIYMDGYGNAVTGIRAESVGVESKLEVRGQSLPHAFTFSSVPPGQAFWYRNSMGLVEIAINQDSASERLDLQIGSEVAVR